MLLVTGATGFLGAELARQLISKGTRFRATKRSGSFIPPDLIHENIEWVDADMLNYFELEKAFQGITRVYHCAATISFQSSESKGIIQNNKEGTAHIVNLCLDNNIERLLHVSSITALGEPKKNEFVTERTIWQYDGTQQGYSISKHESEMEVWRGIAEGLNAVIVNPSVIIGTDTHRNKSKRLFDTIKKGLRFYTDGNCALVDVRDVAAAMILLMNEPTIKNERFIVNAANISFVDLFRIIANGFNVPAPTLRARQWMINIAWRSAALLSFFTGKRFALTKETALASAKKHRYSSDKFNEQFPDFRFIPIAESIKEIIGQHKEGV